MQPLLQQVLPASTGQSVIQWAAPRWIRTENRTLLTHLWPIPRHGRRTQQAPTGGSHQPAAAVLAAAFASSAAWTAAGLAEPYHLCLLCWLGLPALLLLHLLHLLGVVCGGVEGCRDIEVDEVPGFSAIGHTRVHHNTQGVLMLLVFQQREPDCGISSSSRCERARMKSEGQRQQQQEQQEQQQEQKCQLSVDWRLLHCT